MLLDEPPEEEDGLRGAQPASAAAPAPVRARLGAQVRAAGCIGGEVQVHGGRAPSEELEGTLRFSGL